MGDVYCHNLAKLWKIKIIYQRLFSSWDISIGNKYEYQLMQYVFSNTFNQGSVFSIMCITLKHDLTLTMILVSSVKDNGPHIIDRSLI